MFKNEKILDNRTLNCQKSFVFYYNIQKQGKYVNFKRLNLTLKDVS